MGSELKVLPLLNKGFLEGYVLGSLSWCVDLAVKHRDSV